MKSKIKSKMGVYAMESDVARNETEKITKVVLCVICFAFILSCVCSCSQKSEVPVVTSIVYVGSDGQVLDKSYEETVFSGADNKSNPETEMTMTSTLKETESTLRETESEEALIDEAIKNAESLLEAGQYDQALASLIEVKSRVSDRSRIIDEENRINSYRPVALYDLSPMTKTKGNVLNPIKWDANRVLNTGETGKKGVGAVTYELLSLCGYPGRTHGVTSASYDFYIQGEFDQLSGEFYISGESESHKNTPMSLSLNIYADGVLIYSSEELTKGSLPINVLVDIPPCQILRVEFVTSTTNIKDGISEETQYGSAFVNAYLSKKYVPLD